MEDILGTELVTQGLGTMPVSEATASAKYVGLYFGAHWAPCCRRFTTNLKEEYAAINKDNKDFEVVFVSKDGNQAAFDRNFEQEAMPWKAIKYDDEARKKSLEQKYGIMEIPMLIILAPNGQQVSDKGISDLQNHRKDSVEAWDKMVQAQEAEAGAAA